MPACQRLHTAPAHLTLMRPSTGLGLLVPLASSTMSVKQLNTWMMCG